MHAARSAGTNFETGTSNTGQDTNNGEDEILRITFADIIGIRDKAKQLETLSKAETFDAVNFFDKYVPRKKDFSLDVDNDIDKSVDSDTFIEFEDVDELVTDKPCTKASEFVNEIIKGNNDEVLLWSQGGYEEVIKITSKFIANGGRSKNKMHTYNDKKKALINYARLLNLIQQFVECYRQLIGDNEIFRNLIAPNNSSEVKFPLKYCHDQVINGMFHYGIEPLEKIVNHGDGKVMIERLVNMTKYLAFKNRDKICRSLVVLIYLYHHYFNDRKDIGGMILSNISKMNNQNVEDYNSAVQRIGSPNAEASFATLHRDSLLVEISYNVKEVELEAITKDIPDNCEIINRSRGEICKQENMHKNSKYQRDFDKIKIWIVNHYEKLNMICNQMKSPLEAEFNQYSIDSSIIIGCEKLNGTNGIIDKYNDYLEKDRINRLRAATNSTNPYENNPDYYALLAMTKDYLIGFLLTMNPTCKKIPDGTKVDLIKHILEKYNIEEFISYVCENNLHTSVDAKKCLDELKLIRSTKKKAGTLGDIVDGEESEDELIVKLRPNKRKGSSLTC